MRSADRTVLVTGGAGYIGSHACKALAQAGYAPVTFDNLSYGHQWAVKWGPLVIGDILDRASLDAAIDRYRPSAVMHFAACAYVGESVADPGKYFRNNVCGSLNIIEAMRDHGIRSIVFSSTCATYGIPESLPITEETPQRPINPYGASKLMVERILQDFGTAHRINSIALRYFNAAGADPENEIGEDHDPETHLIPLALDACSGKRSSVTLFGSNYDTDDGTCVRDYIHVSDLADAHVKALQALERSTGSSAYNLGNGWGFSVRQVIDTVESVTRRRVPVAIGARRAGDPPALISDATRAREELLWKPRISSLSDIVQTAWAWHERQQLDPMRGHFARPVAGSWR
ncbi:UDP-glucose 4-epimerase GalE [Hyphomicrobium facile]|uniref:UDP-glucose 4-epimerase n=1 Tax=Hyphomicrobium facile TaxID=51670 RepID=A0A1I7NDL9_9HYPH|nr:UDP-glucose 4-epimerase GalE [Hyphomicrobium facile]SFV32739.1 UDP-arabinose 4-epimerase [Hyphomicrobium facile]